MAGQEVFHYSIPSFDVLGDGAPEMGETIGSAKLRVRGDELLVARLNPRKSRVLEIRPQPTLAVCSSEFVVLRPTGINRRFLRYVFLSERVRQELDARTQSVTRSQQRVDPEDISKLRVLLPPLPVQRAIADFLNAETARIDALLARRAAALELLLERRTALTVSGVSGARITGPRKPCGLAWLESIPSHWDEVKLTLVAELGSGHTPSREHPEWWVDCTIPWITTGEVAQLRSDRVEVITETRGKISELGLANSAARLRPSGTVVLCRTASAGYSAIMGADMATSQDFVTWTCGPRLRPRYLLLCLRAMRGDLLGRLAMGSTHKTIYMPDIESIRVPVPPVDEQDAIVDDTWRRLSAIDVATDAIDHQIALLHERRQALITAAVTGELEIPERSAS
jgi:type I restriction enzyme S subunit